MTYQSELVLWSQTERLFVKEGNVETEYVPIKTYKNTVHLTENQNVIAINEQEAKKARDNKAFKHSQDARYVFKLAHGPDLSEDQQRAAIAAHIVEVELQQRLFRAGVAVPEVVKVVPANDLLNADGLGLSHPPLFIMAFVDGQPLSALPAQDSLHQRAEFLQRLWTKLVDLVKQLERQQVIHRDLKPDNIFVTEHGPELVRLVLLDFEKASAADTTVYSTVAGPFAAPEVHRGLPCSTADHYSLVALSFFLLTHQLPSLENRDRLALDKLFKPMQQFWLRGFAEASAQRFEDIDALNNAFNLALCAFVRALKPREEAEDLRQRLQQHYDYVVAASRDITLAIDNMGEVFTRLRQSPNGQWPSFYLMLSAIELDYAALLGAQQQLDITLNNYQNVFQQRFDTDEAANNWLHARQYDPDLQQALAALQQQLAELVTAERLFELDNALTMPSLLAVESQLTLCHESFARLKNSVDDTKQEVAQQQNQMLTAYEDLLAIRQRDYTALQAKMSQAYNPLQSFPHFI